MLVEAGVDPTRATWTRAQWTRAQWTRAQWTRAQWTQGAVDAGAVDRDERRAPWARAHLDLRGVPVATDAVRAAGRRLTSIEPVWWLSAVIGAVAVALYLAL